VGTKDTSAKSPVPRTAGRHLRPDSIASLATRASGAPRCHIRFLTQNRPGQTVPCIKERDRPLCRQSYPILVIGDRRPHKHGALQHVTTGNHPVEPAAHREPNSKMSRTERVADDRLPLRLVNPDPAERHAERVATDRHSGRHDRA
jgi:hypothetical protein